ncbi:hypothetical protein [Halovenus marina]|uniref:hypothetical protein n=1 Tax=Halovenus marina TaxID=3396621 RepID=UPI003F548BA6
MTAVRIVDSLKYGAVLLGYFLVVGVVGIGGMALGGALAIPELESLIDDTSYETAELVGGSVLGLLGFAVWTGGLFALAHKLIADSVARGQADVSVTLSEDSAAATRTVTDLEQTVNGSTAQQRTGSESAASQQPTAEHTDTEPSTATEADRPEAEAGERGWSGNWSRPEATDSAQSQTERSAEEIAFGNEGRRSETDVETTSPDAEGTTSSGPATETHESERATEEETMGEVPDDKMVFSDEADDASGTEPREESSPVDDSERGQFESGGENTAQRTDAEEVERETADEQSEPANESGTDDPLADPEEK